jgi:hypothetical protein
MAPLYLTTSMNQEHGIVLYGMSLVWYCIINLKIWFPSRLNVCAPNKICVLGWRRVWWMWLGHNIFWLHGSSSCMHYYLLRYTHTRQDYFCRCVHVRLFLVNHTHVVLKEVLIRTIPQLFHPTICEYIRWCDNIIIVLVLYLSITLRVMTVWRKIISKNINVVPWTPELMKFMYLLGLYTLCMQQYQTILATPWFEHNLS